MGKRRRFQKSKLVDKTQVLVDKALNHPLWLEYALLDFITAYQCVSKQDPTIKALQLSGIVSEKDLPKYLSKLEHNGDIRIWSNGYKHYHAYTLAESNLQEATGTEQGTTKTEHENLAA